MKALLVAGLISAGAVLSSQAQTVYSINAVGFVNVTIPTGFSMIANQLDNGSGNTLSTLFPTPPNGFKVFKFNGSSYDIYQYAGSPFNAWFPNGDATLAPGEGAFVQNSSGSSFTATFVGEVKTGSLSNPLPAGFSIKSSILPQSGALTTTLGFPTLNGDKVYKFNNGNNSYDIYQYAGSPFNAWFPSEPSVNVAESFFVYKAGSGSWDRTYSVGQ